jgi:hypothetical protein
MKSERVTLSCQSPRPCHGAARATKFKPNQHVIVLEFDKNNCPRLRNLKGGDCSKEEIGLLLTALESHGKDSIEQLEESSEDDDDPGYVYLIAGEGRYNKIGKTRDTTSRHRQLKILMPFAISLEHFIRTNSMKRVEEYWHYRFSSTVS